MGGGGGSDKTPTATIQQGALSAPPPPSASRCCPPSLGATAQLKERVIKEMNERTSCNRRGHWRCRSQIIFLPSAFVTKLNPSESRFLQIMFHTADLWHRTGRKKGIQLYPSSYLRECSLSSSSAAIWCLRELHDRNLFFRRSASEKCREKVEIYSETVKGRNVNYVTVVQSVGPRRLWTPCRVEDKCVRKKSTRMAQHSWLLLDMLS